MGRRRTRLAAWPRGRRRLPQLWKLRRPTTASPPPAPAAFRCDDAPSSAPLCDHPRGVVSRPAPRSVTRCTEDCNLWRIAAARFKKTKKIRFVKNTKQRNPAISLIPPSGLGGLGGLVIVRGVLLCTAPAEGVPQPGPDRHRHRHQVLSSSSHPSALRKWGSIRTCVPAPP